MRTHVFIAQRYLRSKSRSGFISLISYLSIGGVTIGVAALIIVLSVMNGFESEVRERILGADAHIRLTTYGDRGITAWEEAAASVRQVPHVTGVSPYIFEKGMLRVGNSTEGAMIRAMDETTLAQVSELPKHIISGRFSFSANGMPGIIVGRFLAERLGISPGDTLVLFSPAGMTSTFSAPAVKKFVLTGVFQTGLFEFDDVIAYMDVNVARDLFKRGERVDGLEIKLDNMFLADKVKEQLEEKFSQPYYAQTWFELRSTLFSWMKIEKWMWTIILSLVILVAAFNILSTLIMVTMEKRRDIGILKAMGAKDRDVARIFSAQGLIVGILGSVLGTLLGFLICLGQLRYRWVALPSDIYFLDALPVKMQPLDFILVITIAILLSYLGAVYPARYASRLVPVDAIRDVG
ncbi:FtsX-like permease family protein [candidate division KSB1 bacterium]|nr:MAG: FtsX-like permease family protein [candidate division KSB1 bacterium]